MNKILNWTFGSIFRTIGRIVAYILIGALLVFLAQSNDFHFPSWLFIKVNASEFKSYVVDWKDPSGNSLPQYYGQYRMYSTFVNYIDSHFNTYAPIPDGTKGIIVSVNFRDLYTGTTAECTDVGAQGTNDYCEKLIWSSENTLSFSAFYNNSNNKTTCYFLGNSIDMTNNASGQLYTMIYCPIPSNIENKNFGGVSFTGTIGSYGTNQPTNFYIGLEKTILFDIDGNSAIINNQNQNTQDIINNQNQNAQQQQQQHEETMNSSTEDAENDAEGFFEDFDIPDTGGLSAIITAPLNTINSLLTNSCSNLTLPLPFVNENLTLPCLYSIYNQHFGLFFTLYQTIILAIVSYRCIRSIYFDITGFLDPNDDRIEVMDL